VIVHGKMVNELHLYSAFTDPMVTKVPHIHPFTHSFIHWKPSKYHFAVTCSHSSTFTAAQ